MTPQKTHFHIEFHVNITSQHILTINKQIHMFLETLDNDKYFSRIFENLGGRLHPGRLRHDRHIFFRRQHASTSEGNHFYFTSILRKYTLFHYIPVFRMITPYSWSSHTILERRKVRKNFEKNDFLTSKTE